MKPKPTLRTAHTFLVPFIVLYFCSCASTRSFQYNPSQARDMDKKSFVQKTDGTVIEANEARLRMPLFGKSTVTLDGDQKIPVKEIVAYQNDKAYYHKVDHDFATRITKGLINVYQLEQTYTEYSAGGMGPGYGRYGNSPGMRTRTRILYYLQKGDSATVERFTPSLARTYVQNYAPAMEFMDLYDANQHKTRIWSVVNTTAVVGGLLLTMTQGIRNDKVTSAGYAGLGLFAGGLVSGVVNKVRRVRNVRNVQLAIDTYNAQVVKTKR
jgi:hypothetical protein